MEEAAPTRNLRARFVTWLDRVALHPSLRDGGPDLRRRAHLAVVFAAISGLGACALGLNHLSYGIRAEGFLFVGFGLAAFGAIATLKRTGSLVIAGNVVSALWFVAMIASTASRGGLMSHGSMGIAAVPVVAVVLAGRRWGMFWCLMSVGLLGTLFGLESAGYELVDRAPPGSHARIALISTVLFVGVMYLMGSAHEAMKSAAIAELAKTERAKVEAEAEAKLHEADRLASVGRLAAAVAHEINNPLTYILGNVGWVREDLESGEPFDPEEAAELLADVVEGAERIRIIVQDLNTFSRAEEQVRSVDLDNALGSALRMAAHQIRHRAVVRRDIRTDAAVMANPARLGQVLLNLLINAAHAIPIGRAEDNEIAVIARDYGPHVAIEVIDTGVGIAPELLDRVTEPFFTTKGVGEGSGLGLSVCKNIIERLGGRLEIESTVDQGTTARILLPRASSHARQPRQRSSASRALPAQPRRVLLVDDDPRLLAHMTRMLGGHEITTAENGREALTLIDETGGFDVIVCDLMMPEVTGPEVYDALRGRRPDQAERFIAVTGGAFREEAQAFLARFEGPVVKKPFAARVLQRRVEDMPRMKPMPAALAS